MSTRQWLLNTLFALAVTSSSALAGEDDTMIVVEDGASPEDIVNVITLPDFAAERAAKKARLGHETANNAKTLGKAFGREMADQAKSKGMSEHIRDDMRRNGRSGVENRGRAPNR